MPFSENVKEKQTNFYFNEFKLKLVISDLILNLTLTRILISILILILILM